MKTSIRIALSAVMVGLLGACSAAPVGISKSEWARLTPTQRATVHRLEAQSHRQDMRDLQAFSTALGPYNDER